MKYGGMTIMIKGHNPNRQQKGLLMKNEYDWHDWLVIKDFGNKVEFRNKKSNEVITLEY